VCPILHHFAEGRPAGTEPDHARAGPVIPEPEWQTGTAVSATEELVDRFFAAIEAVDIAALRGIYATDAVVWHNDSQAEQGVEDNLRTLASVHRTVKGPRYTQIRRVMADDGLVQQHVLCGTAPGGALLIPAIVRIYVLDDHITRIEEYLDPRQADVLRG